MTDDVGRHTASNQEQPSPHSAEHTGAESSASPPPEHDATGPSVRPGQTRDRLLETALSLFADYGYDAVGTQRIVAEAGVTKPTLYHYFGSKRGLLEAVVADLEASLSAMIAGARNYEGDLPATLEGMIAAVLNFAAARPREARLLPALYYGPRRSEARRVVQPVIDRLNRSMQELFRTAAADHGNMRGRERPYAANFLGLLFTYTQLVVDGEVDPTPELAYRLMHRFSHGIYS